ncbi:MAG: gamma-glutamyl-gamma-aminobutyrate hydrolase family protein [Candidatus Methylomirabilales bacterium]
MTGETREVIQGRPSVHPRICITSGRHSLGEEGAGHEDTVRGAYSWCVAESGGVPYILPTPGYDREIIASYLDVADGLLFSGGEDIHPSFYGEFVLEKCGVIDEKRDLFEIELLRGAVERGMPVLGVCRGMQLIAVALGGSLYQDLAYCDAAMEFHDGTWEQGGEIPSVTLTPGTLLHHIFGGESLRVNCRHHQLVKALDQTCRVNAFSPDGMIEGIEVSESPFVLGVHWHPERLALGDQRHLELFKALVKAAAAYSKKARNPG